MTKLFVPLMILLCVTGCAPTPARIEYQDLGCTWSRMVRPSAADVDLISRRLAEDIVLQNDAYKEHCMKEVK